MDDSGPPPALPFDPNNRTDEGYDSWLNEQAVFGDQDQYAWRDMMRRAVVADKGNRQGLAACLAEMRRQGAALDTTGPNPIFTRGTIDTGTFVELALRWIEPYLPVLEEILNKISLPGSASHNPRGLGRVLPWRDPRPDLRADHELWTNLLAIAFHHKIQNSTSLFSVLLELRVRGAHLAVAENTARLNAGTMDPSEYMAVRQQLLEHSESMKEMLREVVRMKV